MRVILFRRRERVGRKERVGECKDDGAGPRKIWLGPPGPPAAGIRDRVWSQLKPRSGLWLWIFYSPVWPLMQSYHWSQYSVTTHAKNYSLALYLSYPSLSLWQPLWDHNLKRGEFEYRGFTLHLPLCPHFWLDFFYSLFIFYLCFSLTLSYISFSFSPFFLFLSLLSFSLPPFFLSPSLSFSPLLWFDLSVFSSSALLCFSG